VSGPSIWRTPVVLNVAIVCGLAWALLADGWLAKALATAVTAVPVGVVVYHVACRARPRHKRSS
jgi:hypothetical protein